MTNPKDLTMFVPDSGEASIQAIAMSLETDVQEVRDMALAMEQNWLFTVKGDSVAATEVLRCERENGLLPRYMGGKPTTKERHEKALNAADRLVYKADPMRVLEFAALFRAGEDEIRGKFMLERHELTAILQHLGCEGLIEMPETSRLGIFKKRTIHVLDTPETLDVKKRHLPDVRDEDYKRAYHTNIDVMADLVDSFSPLKLEAVSRHVNATPDALLPIAETLHERGILTLRHRGANSVLEARAHGRAQKPGEKMQSGKVVERYRLGSGETDVEALIIEDSGEFRYKLRYPVFQQPTQAVLDRIYEQASPGAIDGLKESANDSEGIKTRLKEDITAAIRERLPFVDEETQEAMIRELRNELHLGRLEYLLADSYIEEIKAQSGRPVFIKHVKCRQEWIETNLTLTDESMAKYAKAIARETRQQIDSSHPLMDAILHTGDRVNCCLPETAGGSYVIEIRVFSKNPWNFVRLVKKGTVSIEVLAFLWLAIQYKLNVLVSGETGSGKTSFVNALSLFLPKNDHIISVEDTRELQLPKIYKNWSHMTTRLGNSETEVTMSRLLVNALRMNPSFIIMGEVRTSQDIETLMRATSMGHPVMSTIHTRDCSTTIKRFEDSGITAGDLENIHLNVILEAVKSKDDPQPKRRVKEVGEYIIGGGKASANRIYRLDMNTDTICLVNEPRGYYQLVMDKVNMNKEEIQQDLEAKKTIIQWLLRWDVEDIETLGKIIQLHYNDPGRTIKAARQNKEPREMTDYEA